MTLMTEMIGKAAMRLLRHRHQRHHEQAAPVVQELGLLRLRAASAGLTVTVRMVWTIIMTATTQNRGGALATLTGAPPALAAPRHQHPAIAPAGTVAQGRLQRQDRLVARVTTTAVAIAAAAEAAAGEARPARTMIGTFCPVQRRKAPRRGATAMGLLAVAAGAGRAATMTLGSQLGTGAALSLRLARAPPGLGF